MFGSTARKLNWKTPASLEELQALLLTKKPIIVFKHSERCPISRMALKQFETAYTDAAAELIFIEVREQKALSNYLTEQWNIVHQSPQVLVQDGQGNHFSASHNNISANEVISFILKTND
jgi:bacillithiol system protein YtxJ